MGAAEHDSRVRDFFRRVWNERDYAAAGRLYADTFSNPAAPGVRGAAAKAMFIRSYHQAFPDLAVTIEDLVAADRVVAVRYVAAGTDLGGFHGKPPTGRRVTMWAVSFLRFSGDQVVGEWTGADYLGCLHDQEPGHGRGPRLPRRARGHPRLIPSQASTRLHQPPLPRPRKLPLHPERQCGAPPPARRTRHMKRSGSLSGVTQRPDHRYAHW